MFYLGGPPLPADRGPRRRASYYCVSLCCYYCHCITISYHCFIYSEEGLYMLFVFHARPGVCWRKVSEAFASHSIIIVIIIRSIFTLRIVRRRSYGQLCVIVCHTIVCHCVAVIIICIIVLLLLVVLLWVLVLALALVLVLLSLFVRPIVTLRIVRPTIFESTFRNHRAKKLVGALRKPTSFM